MRSALITAQTRILSEFDSFLLSTITVEFHSQGITYQLFGNRALLRKFGFVFNDSDKFLSARELNKLRPLLDDFSRLKGAKKGNQKRCPSSSLLSAFCFVSNAPTRPSFFTTKPLWLHHSVSLSQAVSTAFESLEVPLIGAFIAIRNRNRFIVRKGSQVRGVLVAHYLQMFDLLSLPTSGPDFDMIKCIKASFYKFFVRTLSNYQQSPELGVVGSWPQSRSFSIIPRSSWRAIQDEIMRDFNGPSKIVQLAYCIFQSKSICEPVSNDFIRRSLESHCDLLCRTKEDRILSPLIIDTLEKVGQEFGDVVARHYTPFLTVPPTKSACFERNRKKGGLNSFVSDHFSHPPASALRCEPLVIGLFGPPGGGKTTSLYSILRVLETELQLPGGEMSVYFRNPHLDHWDGYKNQDIVVIDDFGQDLVNSPDLREFDQMVSCSTFFPPMAALDSKGIRFTSKIILLTSNLTFGQRLVNPSGEPLLVDPLSVWRRIHLPILVMPRECRIRKMLGTSTLYSSDRNILYDDMRIDMDSHGNDLFDSVEDFSSPVPLFFRILPLFGSEGSTTWMNRGLNGILASAYSHICTLDHIPAELSYIPEMVGSGTISRSGGRSSSSTVTPPFVGSYHLTDARNTGMNIISYSLSDPIALSDVHRDLLSLYYLRLNTHYEMMGIWPQVIVDEHICLSVPDHPDPEFIDFMPTYSETLGDWGLAERFDLPQAWKSRVPTDSSIPVKKVLFFPSSPDFSSPPQVKAIGLAEPLKCRVITVPEAKSRCLKPFQMAMHKALSFFPQFSLTHSAYWSMEGDFVESTSVRAVQASLRSLSRRFLLSPNRLCLSGDYESATDNFLIEVSSILLRSILQKIPHRPTREWCLWELSPARISYPFGVFLQQRGQRMGSLLSFPLLCLANEALCRICKFDRGSYLINGDDLAAGVTHLQHDDWKKFGPLIGLKPNEKYFISSGNRKVILINSQLFDINLVSILPAGKLSCMVRRDKPLASCLEYLQRYYGKSVLRCFVRLNLHRLRATPRSPFVPVAFGGLSLVFSSGFDTGLAKVVYLLQLWKRIWRTPQKIPGTHFSICTIPCLWRDTLDCRQLERSIHHWRNVEHLADFQQRRYTKFSDLGYSRPTVELFSLGKLDPVTFSSKLVFFADDLSRESLIPINLPLGETLDFNSPLVDNPWQTSVTLHDQISRELLGSRPDSSPWYSDVRLEEDPLESVFISLCKLQNVDYRNNDDQAFDDYSWSDYKLEKDVLFPLLSPLFKEWLHLLEKLHSLPPLTVFSTRFIVCPTRSVSLLRQSVLSRLEDYLQNETIVSFDGPEGYKKEVDCMLDDFENPIFSKSFLKILSSETQDVDFLMWNQMVLSQVSTLFSDQEMRCFQSSDFESASEFLNFSHQFLAEASGGGEVEDSLNH